MRSREWVCEAVAADRVEQAQVAAHQLAGYASVARVRGCGGYSGFDQQGAAQAPERHSAARLVEEHRHHAVNAGVVEAQQMGV
jgi:hypothetical protein